MVIRNKETGEKGIRLLKEAVDQTTMPIEKVIFLDDRKKLLGIIFDNADRFEPVSPTRLDERLVRAMFYLAKDVIKFTSWQSYIHAVTLNPDYWKENRAQMARSEPVTRENEGG